MKPLDAIATVLLPVLAAPLAAHAAIPRQETPAKPPSSVSAKPNHHTLQFSATPVFRDANGKAISEKAFDAATRQGQRYTLNPDMHTGTVVMQLLPPGVNTPGSISAADSQAASITLLMIDGVHYEVVFHDVHGKTIDQQAFAAGAAQHQRYTTTLDKQGHKAILTLLPAGVDKPKSQPVANWAVVSPEHMAPAPKPGTRFAGFDLPEVGGGRIDDAKLKGKPYVVDFFFADCIGCIAELPVLNTYHQRYPQQRVFALTFDDGKTAAGFVRQRHFDWPVAYDGKAFIDKLGIEVYPTMVLVGADGKVIATRIGSDTGLTPKKLEQWVADHLGGQHPPATTR